VRATLADESYWTPLAASSAVRVRASGERRQPTPKAASCKRLGKNECFKSHRERQQHLYWLSHARDNLSVCSGMLSLRPNV
jgi:hypothetical protein